MTKLILELIGTIAFAVSGAVVGIQKKMDILGVTVLGAITAVGGGVIRDVLMGTTPPSAFRNPVYLIIAIVASLIVFIPAISARINLDHVVWIITDSIGLGVFTIVGVSAGMPSKNIFFAIFLGVTTGVGGGVIRDICANEVPMIFIKHFYACPCIIGAVVGALIYSFNANLAFAAGISTVVVLRLLAAKFRWHLPKAK